MQNNKPQFSLKRIEPTAYVFSKDKRLGKGAFGQVYFGFDQKNKIPIAVKTISFEKIVQSNSNLDSFFQKLIGQMANMQICKSKNLVELISPHKSTKNMYLVCEYCNGGSLKDYLNQYSPLSQYQALYFFREILKGIQILHEKKVVHRDLKPANILIHDYQLKIGDLGFSKSLEVHEQILTSIVGTPLYMSPQILSQKHYTAKTDVWSLGIMLFQMLCGEAPWRVNSIHEIIERTKTKPDFNKIPNCSDSIKQILSEMLQFEQKNRISLQQLFKLFELETNYAIEEESMKDENQEQSISEQMKKCHEYFTFSLLIHSEHKIKKILMNNKKQAYPTVDNSSCHNARQFITKILYWEKAALQIDKCFHYFRIARNKIAYLMNIFFMCYDILTKSGNLCYAWKYQGIGKFGSFMALMIVIVRYSVEIIYSLLDCLNRKSNHKIMDSSQFDLFIESSLSKNLKELFALDIQYLFRMYPALYQNFISKIINNLDQKIKSNRELINNLQPFLSSKLPLYQGKNGSSAQSEMEDQGISLNSQRDSIQYLEFLLKYYLSTLHNDLVLYIVNNIEDEEVIFSNLETQQQQPLSFSVLAHKNSHHKDNHYQLQKQRLAYIEKGIILTKIIYQYHRHQKTEIFQDSSKKINIYKRIENWHTENTVRKWYKKLKEEKNLLTVQSINVFLSKKVKMNPISMYQIGFL